MNHAPGKMREEERERQKHLERERERERENMLNNTGYDYGHAYHGEYIGL